VNSTSSNIDPTFTYPSVHVALALFMVLSSFVILRKFLATDKPKQPKTSTLMISHIPIAVCKKGTEFFLSHIK
jgi:peptidoglycan/LPS O-acetylase OafA/YrhL